MRDQVGDHDDDHHAQDGTHDRVGLAPRSHTGEGDHRKRGQVESGGRHTNARLNGVFPLSGLVDVVGPVEALFNERTRVRPGDLEDRVVNGGQDCRSQQEQGDDRG